MRALHIYNISAENPHKNEIKARIQKCSLKDLSMDTLLREFNQGNIQVLDELLSSAEGIILKVMLYMPESSYSIDDCVSHATASLKQLALIGAKDPSQRLFERFCAFDVKQSLLALESF